MANVNTMAFNQLATVLTSIVAQATGKAQITAVDESQFVSVAQIGLKTGYDPLATAVSQVLSRTIFSVRPYTAKFKGLMADSVRYGNHERKLTTIDKPFEDDQRFGLTDGYAIDPWIVNKPEVLQTNIYGANTYEKSLTIYKDQLDCAFSSSEEFGRFIAMIMQNASDMIEQAREETARATVTNLIAGCIYQDANSIASNRVVRLLEVYEAETGTSLTSATVQDPDNFAPFARWMFGYLKTLSDRLTERSALYHQNYTDSSSVVHYIMRHTPLDRQKCYLFSPLLNSVSANVLSTVFYDKYLKLMDHEDVAYWQSIITPMRVLAKPSVTTAGLTQVDMANVNAVDNSHVFGIIFDEEACGFTEVNQWSASTPLNPRGGYTNIFWHFTHRFWADYTENAVVLLLENTAAKENPQTSVGTTRTEETREIPEEPIEEPVEEKKATKKASK